MVTEIAKQQNCCIEDVSTMSGIVSTSNNHINNHPDNNLTISREIPSHQL